LIRHTDCNKFSIQVQSLISQQSQYSIKTKNNNLFLSLSLLSLPIFFTLTSSSFLFFFSFFSSPLPLLTLTSTLSLSTLYLIVNIWIQLFGPKESYSLLLHHKSRPKTPTRNRARGSNSPFSIQVLSVGPIQDARVSTLSSGCVLCS